MSDPNKTPEAFRGKLNLMSRRIFPTLSCLSALTPALLLTLTLTLTLPPARSAELPNIIFIIADDLGYGELSIQDPDTDVPTPHIDSIAEHGVRFTDGYVTAPFCAASRAGLITGRYQTRFGFEFNPIGPRNEDPDAGLPSPEKTLADILRDEAGYSTAMIGKWHLGGTAYFNPLRRGFDEFFGFLHEGHYFRPLPYEGMTTWLRRKVLPGGKTGRWTSEDGTLIFSTHMGGNEPDYDADNPVYRNGQPVVEPENLTDAFTREAVDFIRRCGGERPFFLYLSYNAVHSPLQGDRAYMEKFAGIEDIQRRIFAAMLGQMDDGVGRVLDAVAEAGIREDTMIVFLSDNGGPTRELTSSNLPLKGGKGSLNEGGIRVPFLLQYPAKIEAGQVYGEAITSLDLFPTSLALAGLAPPVETDGVDLIPYLTGGKAGSPHESIYWRVGDRAALRKGDWKIVRERQRGQPGPWQLFQLREDIGEENDLAGEENEILEDLVEEWERYDAKMVEAVFPQVRRSD